MTDREHETGHEVSQEDREPECNSSFAAGRGTSKTITGTVLVMAEYIAELKVLIASLKRCGTCRKWSEYTLECSIDEKKQRAQTNLRQMGDLS